MREAGEGELGAGVELGFDKTAEERGRGGPVEAMIVIQNSHQHEKGNGKPASVSQMGGDMQVPVVSLPWAKEMASREIAVLFYFHLLEFRRRTK